MIVIIMIMNIMIYQEKLDEKPAKDKNLDVWLRWLCDDDEVDEEVDDEGDESLLRMCGGQHSDQDRGEGD